MYEGLRDSIWFCDSVSIWTFRLCSAQKTRHNRLNYTKQQIKTAWEARGGRHGKIMTNHYHKDRNHVRKRRKLHKFKRTNPSNQEHTQGGDPGYTYRRNDKIRNKYQYDGTDAKNKEPRAYRTDRQVAGDIAARQTWLRTLSVIARHGSTKENCGWSQKTPCEHTHVQNRLTPARTPKKLAASIDRRDQAQNSENDRPNQSCMFPYK